MMEPKNEIEKSKKESKKGSSWMTMEKTDLLVIGAGPAGISAALYARRGGLSVTVVTKGIETGGLSKAEKIENYYGFAEPISGKELLRRGAAGARRLGVEIVEEELLALSFNDTFDGFKAASRQHEWEASAVVLAAGASRRTLPMPGIAEFEGKGVSYCAICDAFFYRGKKVAVIGSGEYAVHEAQVLLPHAEMVTLLTNGEPLTAEVPDDVAVCDGKIAAAEGAGRVVAHGGEDAVHPAVALPAGIEKQIGLLDVDDVPGRGLIAVAFARRALPRHRHGGQLGAGAQDRCHARRCRCQGGRASGDECAGPLCCR